MSKPVIVAMDLEGVLVPEVWINVAEKTGIEALKRTTRDEPDYDVLMQYRLDILAKEGIDLPTIQKVIGELEPLPGAIEYVEWVKRESQLIILSDTFYQFAGPLMEKLGYPTLFCHSLEVNDLQQITGYKLRQPDQKRRCVEAFQSLNFRVIAFGDSYNDTTMLGAAERGVLFRPSDATRKDFPQFPVIQTHDDIRQEVAAFLTE